MNDKAIKGLLEDKFEMGGEASATTNATFDAEILSYSRFKVTA